MQSHINHKAFKKVKGGCIPSKNKFKHKKDNKLRRLASVINLKLLHTWCAIAHGKSCYDH